MIILIWIRRLVSVNHTSRAGRRSRIPVSGRHFPFNTILIIVIIIMIIIVVDRWVERWLRLQSGLAEWNWPSGSLLSLPGYYRSSWSSQWLSWWWGWWCRCCLWWLWQVVRVTLQPPCTLQIIFFSVIFFHHPSATPVSSLPKLSSLPLVSSYHFSQHQHRHSQCNEVTSHRRFISSEEISKVAQILMNWILAPQFCPRTFQTAIFPPLLHWTDMISNFDHRIL